MSGGYWKPDKKPSWELVSSKSRPGRRSMTDGGGRHRNRVVIAGQVRHVMSEEAWRNNFRPKTVSVKINDRWYSATVVVQG